MILIIISIFGIIIIGLYLWWIYKNKQNNINTIQQPLIPYIGTDSYKVPSILPCICGISNLPHNSPIKVNINDTIDLIFLTNKYGKLWWNDKKQSLPISCIKITVTALNDEKQPIPLNIQPMGEFTNKKQRCENKRYIEVKLINGEYKKLLIHSKNVKIL